ncbi:MAG: phosphoribosylglycinamide formyltransferase [Bacteroidota bacterium]
MRLALFASGGGSNAEAILRAIKSGTLPAEAAVVISNKATAGALKRAERHGVPTVVLDPRCYKGMDGQYASRLAQVLGEHGADFIALAGYLRKIPSSIVEQYRNRIVNVHPSLLPAFGGGGFYGRRVHEAVIEHGVRWTGVTIHIVDEAYDTGPIVLQEPVPVMQGDAPEDLAARVLAVEHRLYPHALALFAKGRVHIEGRRVRIDLRG